MKDGNAAEQSSGWLTTHELGLNRSSSPTSLLVDAFTLMTAEMLASINGRVTKSSSSKFFASTIVLKKVDSVITSSPFRFPPRSSSRRPHQQIQSINFPFEGKPRLENHNNQPRLRRPVNIHPPKRQSRSPHWYAPHPHPSTFRQAPASQRTSKLAEKTIP